jgi:lysophospholipase L1-like esterase
MNKKIRVAVIGDSTAMWIRPYRNHIDNFTFVELLIKKDNLDVDIYTRPGMTSHDALILVWNELMGKFYDYCIFNFGINDCVPRSYPKYMANFHNNTLIAQTKAHGLIYLFYRFFTAIKVQKFLFKIGISKPWSNLKKFENNLAEIIKILSKETDSKIIFLTIPKTSKRVEGIFPNINNLIPEYSNAISKLQLNNTNIINIDSMFKMDYDKYIEEGIHYSSHGHQLVYTEILKVLEGKS